MFVPSDSEILKSARIKPGNNSLLLIKWIITSTTWLYPLLTRPLFDIQLFTNLVCMKVIKFTNYGVYAGIYTTFMQI